MLTTETCKECGRVYETKRGHVVCPAKSRTIVFCEYCGGKIIDVVFHPLYKTTTINTLCGSIICDECAYLASKLLFNNLNEQ